MPNSQFGAAFPKVQAKSRTSTVDALLGAVCRFETNYEKSKITHDLSNTF